MDFEAKKRELLAFLDRPFEEADDKSELARFFGTKNVFITGATGFIGKALVEKLLRACTGIGRIYLLVRPRRGKCAQDRLADLLDSVMFKRLKDRLGADKLLADKLRIISGDITLPCFGICGEDMHELRDSVNIVFNSAATIKFEEPITNAVENNILSLEQLVTFCCELKKLEALVHLSTAYANCHKRDEIHEIFYEPPMKGRQIIDLVRTLRNVESSIYDCSYAVRPSARGAAVDGTSTVANGLPEFTKDTTSQGQHRELEPEADALGKQSGPCARQNFVFGSLTSSSDALELSTLPDEDVDQHLLREFTRIAQLKSNRPNTYTLTKAIAESFLCDLLAEHPNKFFGAYGVPVAIVRPSIVCSTWRQPLAGFVDNFNGPTAGMSSTIMGVLQAMPGEPTKRADIVPLDMVVDCIIAAAWFAANSKSKQWLDAKQLSSQQQLKPFKDKGIYIFNFVSGKRNPITWKPFADVCHKFAFGFPTAHVARFPNSQYVQAGWRYQVFDTLNHKLPAHLIDFVATKVLRQTLTHKTSAVSMYKRVRGVTDLLTPFSSNEWRFDDTNTQALFNLMSDVDKRAFNFDISQVDWLDYLDSYTAGTRIYALRDAPETLEKAARKIDRLRYQRLAVLGLLLALLVYLLVEFLR